MLTFPLLKTKEKQKGSLACGSFFSPLGGALAGSNTPPSPCPAGWEVGQGRLIGVIRERSCPPSPGGESPGELAQLPGWGGEGGAGFTAGSDSQLAKGGGAET